MTTQTTTDFGKYERFLTHWTKNFLTGKSDRTACCGRSNHVVQRKSRISAIYSKGAYKFGTKNYKFCDILCYIYDKSLYLGKQIQHATSQITATHGTVLQLIRRVEGLSNKVFMDNYFTSSALFDDLFQSEINACGRFRPSRRGMPRDIGPKSLKMKMGT
jgi:hypothetical protein